MNRLTKIDELLSQDHYYLTNEDTCYFFGEYTAGEGHSFSNTNQLIFNFKKRLDTRQTPQWQHKERAISTVGAMIRTAILPNQIGRVTFVPIPPSKARTDPMYDDRMVRALRAALAHIPGGGDIRELVLQNDSTDPVHMQDCRRPSPQQLILNYRIDETILEPAPTIIFIVDDVLTTGSHFKAVDQMLKNSFPNVRTAGMFIARRVPKSVEFDDL